MVLLAAGTDSAAGSWEGPKSMPQLHMPTQPPDPLTLTTNPLVQSHSLCPRFPKVQPALLRLGSPNAAYFMHQNSAVMWSPSLTETMGSPSPDVLTQISSVTHPIGHSPALPFPSHPSITAGFCPKEYFLLTHLHKTQEKTHTLQKPEVRQRYLPHTIILHGKGSS